MVRILSVEAQMVRRLPGRAAMLSLAMLLSLPPRPAKAASLEDAWAAAEKEAAPMVVAHEQRVQSDQIRLQAWAALGPKLTLGGNYTINQRETSLDFSRLFPPELSALAEAATGSPLTFGPPVVINKKSYFDAYLTVTQPLFNGAAVPGVRAAGALVDAGQAQERYARSQTRLGVAKAYWGAVVAKQAEAIASEALETAEKHRKLANSMVDRGMLAEQSRLQAEIAVSRAERDLAAAQARALTAEDALLQLTGMGTEGLSVPEVGRGVPFSSEEEALSAAFEKRPDLAASEAQARAAHYQAVATGMTWFPTVSGRFTEAWSQNTGFSGENSNWMIVAAATWPLWDGGYRIAEGRRTASVERMSEAAEEASREKATGEVKAAWAERRRATAAVASAEREVKLATENLRLATVSFEVGASSLVDTDDARLGLAAAELTLLTERMNADLAALTLLAATGGL